VGFDHKRPRGEIVGLGVALLISSWQQGGARLCLGRRFGVVFGEDAKWIMTVRSARLGFGPDRVLGVADAEGRYRRGLGLSIRGSCSGCLSRGSG